MHTIRRIFLILAVVTLIAPIAVAAQASDTGKPVKIPRAQVTGLNNEEANTIVSIAYRERGRLVYDPLVITPDTTVWVRGKAATASAIRLRQYIIVTALRQGDELTAQRIDIGAPPKVVVKKPAPKVIKAAPKATVKTATLPKKP